MATLTTNFGLRKPAGGDIVAVQADINANMDIIDATLFDREEQITELEDFIPVVVLKTADEQVASSTTIQNDDHLFYSLPVAGDYLFDFFVGMRCAGAADMDFDLSFPTGAVLDGFIHAITDSAAATDGPLRSRAISADNASPTSTFAVGGDSANATLLLIHGFITTPIPGTLRFRWAQNVSNATPTEVVQGSHLIVERVA